MITEDDQERSWNGILFISSHISSTDRNFLPLSFSLIAATATKRRQEAVRQEQEKEDEDGFVLPHPLRPRPAVRGARRKGRGMQSAMRKQQRMHDINVFAMRLRDVPKRSPLRLVVQRGHRLLRPRLVSPLSEPLLRRFSCLHLISDALSFSLSSSSLFLCHSFPESLSLRVALPLPRTRSRPRAALLRQGVRRGAKRRLLQLSMWSR